MRKILFRGKRTANGEWVEGNLYVDTDGFCSIMGRDKNLIEPGNVKDVIPETVGQYTGLNDRNGKRIFEGDICDFTAFNYDGSDKQFRGVVTYDGSGFILSDGKEEKDFVFELDYILLNDDGVEVIGNIYDNPELLKDKGG